MRRQALVLAVLGLICLGAQAKQQQTEDPLAGLSPSESELPPGLGTLNLTQIAPLLPLLSQLNATVVASWIPVIEQLDPKALEAWVPVVNGLNASVVEAVAAALPSININTVLDLLPAVNALPAKTLEAYVVILGKIDPKLVDALLPSISVLDPTWVNKVVPALNFVDPDYLVAVVKAIAPELVKISPDQLVALLPAVGSISVETWQKLIELLNKLTPAQLEFLLHLLDVTGPYLDKMVQALNFMRRMLPIDATTYQGKTTVFTKPKGTVGMQNSSVIIAQKQHPTSQPNGGAAPAPAAPPVPTTPVPKTLNGTRAHRRLRSLLQFF